MQLSFRTETLRLPLIAAPLFLASGPELVLACCRAGIIGTLPAHNCRDGAGLASWLDTITSGLADGDTEGRDAAPYGINLVVHRSNEQLEEQLALIEKYRVPLVITSLGAASHVVDTVHGYGGIVFHDVISRRHAEKAAAAGVDGIVAVAAGAGGHTGGMNPFALLHEIRQVFDGLLILSGSLSTGGDIAAAQAMGADLAYMGTRFIASRECRADQAYKEMITAAEAADIVTTDSLTGVTANFLRPSLDAGEAAAVDAAVDAANLGDELQQGLNGDNSRRPWRDIWSAGHGVGSIDDIPAVADLVMKLEAEYEAGLEHMAARMAARKVTAHKTGRKMTGHKIDQAERQD